MLIVGRRRNSPLLVFLSLGFDGRWVVLVLANGVFVSVGMFQGCGYGRRKGNGHLIIKFWGGNRRFPE
jgi:hypothetical protein